MEYYIVKIGENILAYTDISKALDKFIDTVEKTHTEWLYNWDNFMIPATAHRIKDTLCTEGAVFFENCWCWIKKTERLPADAVKGE